MKPAAKMERDRVAGGKIKDLTMKKQLVRGKGSQPGARITGKKKNVQSKNISREKSSTSDHSSFTLPAAAVAPASFLFIFTPYPLNQKDRITITIR